MHSILGCNHPTFALPWRTLLPYLVALHLLHLGSAQFNVVAPSLHVTAIVGQDVVLRCQLSPCKDAWRSDIRWIQQRSSGFVHHYRDGEDLEQMAEYKGRTELLRNGLSDGNLDLRISAVRSSDSGPYSCVVQDGDNRGEAVVNLEVSDPFYQIILSWTVALAVVIALLFGSLVIIALLYRNQGELRAEGMGHREVLCREASGGSGMRCSSHLALILLFLCRAKGCNRKKQTKWVSLHSLTQRNTGFPWDD
uniref:Ig-like domain-containing protein n=1 Tax=Phasianus colchicus TaxID=9054 RepID=A0A669QP10_PHACC